MRHKGKTASDGHLSFFLLTDNPVPVSDDELIINTQSGTQWDSFRHFGQ